MTSDSGGIMGPHLFTVPVNMVTYYSSLYLPGPCSGSFPSSDSTA